LYFKKQKLPLVRLARNKNIAIIGHYKNRKIKKLLKSVFRTYFYFFVFQSSLYSDLKIIKCQSIANASILTTNKVYLTLTVTDSFLITFHIAGSSEPSTHTDMPRKWLLTASLNLGKNDLASSINSQLNIPPASQWV